MPPGDYFLPYIKMIQTIIWFQLIEKGYYSYEEKEELTQMVYLDLLEREEKIIRSFKNESKFSTYLNTVVSNICRDLRKKKIRENLHISDTTREEKNAIFNNIRSTEFTPDQQMVFDEYLKKLKIILNTYPKNSKKIFISLKAIYRLTIILSELPPIDINTNKHKIIQECLSSLNNFRIKNTDQEIYRLLTQIFNMIEGTNKTNDALRKWLEDRIREIIFLLNGNPPEANFNKETFGILFEYYCKKKEEFLQN
jgi:RNA polymerase sigma factor (sigma-70 family)